jgi:hypothetical protein
VADFIQNPHSIPSGSNNIGAVSVIAPPTFFAVFDRITANTGKFIATIFNTSATRKAVIKRVFVYNWQTTGVAGSLLDLELQRITARTVGTLITPISADTQDALSAGIEADHNSTAVTSSGLIKRIIHGSDNAVLGGNNLSVWRSSRSWALEYERLHGTKGITLRQNQGITIQQITTSILSTISVVVEFTDEAA